jgi:hypothetical protein
MGVVFTVRKQKVHKGRKKILEETSKCVSYIVNKL